MAHLFNSGVFFGEGAWHKLGTTLPADDPARSDIDKALVLSGLDYEVGLEEMTRGGRVVTSAKCVVRRDTNEELGVVGNRYRPLQNRDQLDWFKPFLDSGECFFETLGSLKGGAVVWVLAKLNREDMSIGHPNDLVRKYLLLSSSHDGSMITRCGYCPTRVVCRNTLSAAIGDANSQLIRVKHTKGQHKALAIVRETIDLANRTFEMTAEQYRKLAKCGVAKDDIRGYVRNVFEVTDKEEDLHGKTRNMLEAVVGMALNGKGNQGKTLWDAYNGVTEYLTHEYGLSDESRLRANWYGPAKKINDRALSVALQLAG